jgi:AcrR family transcriptional regulator
VTRAGDVPSASRAAPAVASLEEAIFPHLRPAAARRLLLSAHQVFARKGYPAATTREIAAGAGMSPAAMYIHYRSKQDLLFHLSLLGHEACEAVLLTARAAGSTSGERLSGMIAAFAGWHATHHTTARIVHYELTSLTRDNFDAVAVIRRRIDRLIADAVATGITDGSFRLTDPDGTALAMTSMCVDVARWFPAGSLHSPADVSTLYADLALRLVGAAS